jgi:hypothetical protein
VIAVGSRWSLFWKAPHRLEATVTSLEADHVVAQVDHRCGFACALKAMSNTIPIEGELRYTYADFAKLFVPMADDAIALPSSK